MKKIIFLLILVITVNVMAQEFIPIYEPSIFNSYAPVYEDELPAYPVYSLGKVLREREVYTELERLYPEEIGQLKCSGIDLSIHSKIYFVEMKGYARLVISDEEDNIVCSIEIENALPPPVYIP